MRVVPRKESGLADPKSSIGPIDPPHVALYLHHTVTRVTDDPFADWRHVQDVAFGRGFNDVSYNFGVHPRGTIMAGRSVFHMGAHTKGWNDRAVGVALIGNYQERHPTKAQIESLRWLRDFHLSAAGIIAPRVNYDPHSAVVPTACPGINTGAVMNLIRQPYKPPDEPETPKGWEDMFTARAVRFKMVGVTPSPDGHGYVLDHFGRLHPLNGAPEADGTPTFDEPVAVDFDIVEWSDPPKGYVLDGKGRVHPFGGLDDVPDAPGF